ncbi:MAG TPA: hypothetical protein VMG99_00120 [Thermoplasmata archaeon]|nr:hypothetical protein [Thermoplasmata archaeon]
MSERENLFRPIHKGIRLMLYQLGAKLQATDFLDETASNQLVDRMKRDLGNSVANCILCLMSTHSHHEEADFFTRVRVFDPDVVSLVMKEHAEVAAHVRDVAKTCGELLSLRDPARRIEVGDRLVQEINDVVAMYLTHMNNEEALVVPIMWERFTDEQLREMRLSFYDHIPLPLFETWMRWTLPAMNQEELVVLFSGLKKSPVSPRFGDWVRLAHETLEPVRWSGLVERSGIPVPS